MTPPLAYLLLYPNLLYCLYPSAENPASEHCRHQVQPGVRELISAYLHLLQEVTLPLPSQHLFLHLPLPGPLILILASATIK